MLAANLRFVDTAVLRERVLIRFQTGEEFDTPENVIGEFWRQIGNRGDNAIEAERNVGSFSVFLQVDIARIRALGLLYQVLQNLRCREI